MIAKNLSYIEINKNKDKIAVLPIGSLEQHGPYLPIGADSIIAETVVIEVEKQIRNKIVVFPTLYYGCSKEHSGFAGTTFFEFDTYFKLITEIINSIFSAGFKKIFIIGGHGGNHMILQIIQSNWNYEHMDQKVIYHFVYSDETIQFAKKLFKNMEEHAGSVETSIIYALSPEYRKTDKTKLKNADFKQKYQDTFSLYSTNQISRLGVINSSDTLEISPEKGLRLVNFMINETKTKILRLLNHSKKGKS